MHAPKPCAVSIRRERANQRGVAFGTGSEAHGHELIAECRMKNAECGYRKGISGGRGSVCESRQFAPAHLPNLGGRHRKRLR